MIHPLRIAHRGASGQGHAPENTMAAFELALDIGADAVEIDVHLTLDGQVAVVHDETLDRTTNRSGAVAELTAAQVRGADAGSWFSKKFSGQRVPFLEEILELTRNRAMVLVEIKAGYMAEAVLKKIVECNAVQQVVIQSFNVDTIRRVKLLNPTVPAALLVGRLPATPARIRSRQLVRQTLELGANALSVWSGVITPAFIEEIRLRGLSLWTWTVDDEILLRDMVLLGVQGIITNYPDRLNRVLVDLEQEGAIRQPLGRRRRSRWGRRRQMKKIASGKGQRWRLSPE